MATTGSPGPPSSRTVAIGAQSTGIDLQQATLLLVEDDLAHRRLFEEQLRAEGLRPAITAAGSVAEATAVLHAHAEIDLVLLDLGLPDSEGLETIDRVTAAADDVPVIVLTGRSDDPELAVSALRRGAHDYLVKGTAGGSELARAIRYALERHALQQRTSAQLLHQTALHQLEVASTTTLDLQAFVQSAASALQVGLAARWVNAPVGGPVAAGVGVRHRHRADVG